MTRNGAIGGRALRAAAAFLLFIAGVEALVAEVVAQELEIPPVRYPTLPKRAASAAGFVPPGWTLESEAAGDLDRDGAPDLALVLRQSDPRNIVANEGLGENPLNTNPRILAVAMRDRSGDGYRLSFENHSLIPRRDDPVLDDPLSETGGVSVDRGVLRVSLHFFASAGSWSMATTTYSLQFRSGRFELVGFDRNVVKRNTGSTESISINYLSRKTKITRGSIESDAAHVVWKKLPHGPPEIAAIGNGLEFEPEH